MSVVITADSVMEDVMFIAVPVFILLYLFLFSAIGQHVKDSVAEVEKAAYNCNWYDASIPFRKLVLMLLIRCNVESKFEAKPFFEVDLVLVSKVGRRYYLFAYVIIGLSFAGNQFGICYNGPSY